MLTPGSGSHILPPAGPNRESRLAGPHRTRSYGL